MLPLMGSPRVFLTPRLAASRGESTMDGEGSRTCRRDSTLAIAAAKAETAATAVATGCYCEHCWYITGPTDHTTLQHTHADTRDLQHTPLMAGLAIMAATTERGSPEADEALQHFADGSRAHAERGLPESSRLLLIEEERRSGGALSKTLMAEMASKPLNVDPIPSTAVSRKQKAAAAKQRKKDARKTPPQSLGQRGAGTGSNEQVTWGLAKHLSCTCSQCRPKLPHHSDELQERRSRQVQSSSASLSRRQRQQQSLV